MARLGVKFELEDCQGRDTWATPNTNIKMDFKEVGGEVGGDIHWISVASSGD